MAKTREETIQHDLVRQFDALRSLSDGWYDGAGIAPDNKALATLEDWLLSSFPSDLPIPAIVPTQEGNVLMEWDSPGDPSIDIRLNDFRAAFHAFRQDGTDLEREYDLRSGEDRTLLFALLCDVVRGKSR